MQPAATSPNPRSPAISVSLITALPMAFAPVVPPRRLLVRFRGPAGPRPARAGGNGDRDEE